MSLGFIFKKEKQKENEEHSEKLGGIFHDYDIRGEYPEELNEKNFKLLAQSIAIFLKSKKIIVFRDARLSSPVLAKALIESFLEQGINVIDGGITTTPLASWASRANKIDAVMVTASHNVAGTNGLKIYSRRAGPVDVADGMLDIKNDFLSRVSGEKIFSEKNKLGSLERINYTESYQNFFLRNTKKSKGNFRIALDYSNGTTGLILNKILDKLKIRFTTINEEPNGNFPGHPPNPLEPDNHQQIKWLLKNGRYNLGVIFDGDGDRVIFFDEKGELIPTPHLFALLVSFYLPKSSRPKNIVVTSSFSKIAGDIAQDSGGNFYVSPVGRTNVSPLMKKYRSLMGAERSGHYFFKELDYQDSAILTLIKVLGVLEEKKESISKLIKPYNKYITIPEINVPFIEGTEKIVLSEVRRLFSGAKVSKIDGLTIEYKDWWFNLRASNTEDVWRLTLEGEDEDLLHQKRTQIEETIRGIVIDSE